MDFPAPSNIEIGEDRIAIIEISRPRAYYSRGGTVRLYPDTVTYVVVFDTPFKDTNWVFGGLTFVNSQDSDVEVPFLAAMSRVQKSQSGFTFMLNAPPISDGHYLDYTIAEKTEEDQ